MRYHVKLVRDGVLPELRAKGLRFMARRLRDSEYVEFLTAKLEEEIREFTAAGSADERAEELGDVQEVLAALVSELFPNGEVEAAREAKRQARGIFAERTLLLWVEEEQASDA